MFCSSGLYSGRPLRKFHEVKVILYDKVTDYLAEAVMVMSGLLCEFPARFFYIPRLAPKGFMRFVEMAALLLEQIYCESFSFYCVLFSVLNVTDS